MSVNILILFGVMCLNAVTVNGFQCYDRNMNKITCTNENAQVTVRNLEGAAYNVSSGYTYPIFACIRLKQKSEYI